MLRLDFVFVFSCGSWNSLWLSGRLPREERAGCFALIVLCLSSISGKSATIRGSNHGSGVCKEHYALYYVPKSSILLAGTDVRKISSVGKLVPSCSN